MDKDPQYYLKQTNFKYLALTPLQKTRINSAIKNGKNASTLLSPSQSEFLSKIQNKSITNPKNLYDEGFNVAWRKMVLD